MEGGPLQEHSPGMADLFYCFLNVIHPEDKDSPFFS